MGGGASAPEPPPPAPPPVRQSGKEVFETRRQALKDAARRRARTKTIFAGENTSLGGNEQNGGKTILG